MVSYFNARLKCFVYVGVFSPDEAEGEAQPGEEKPRTVMNQTERLADMLDTSAPEIIFKFRERSAPPKEISKQVDVRREKERRIADVIVKVCEWRSLYRSKAMTLEGAAKRVGISKKSLDDYFSQLK